MERGRRIGNYGETAAVGYLRGLGFHILETQYKRLRGEIDIIVRDGAAIVFVEVKYRRSTLSGRPAEAVTPAKQRSIIQTALAYIGENGLDDGDFRFDVIEVFGRELLEINHIKNAFMA